MNIQPNKRIRFKQKYVNFLIRNFKIYFPKILPVQLIEVPPHSRTLKINSSYLKSSIFVQAPYTQFYFTDLIYLYDKKHIITFISNSHQSVLNRNKSIQGRRGLSFKPSIPIFHNCNSGIQGIICWGESKEPLPETPHELINYFWNSRFTYKPNDMNMKYQSYFKVLL